MRHLLLVATLCLPGLALAQTTELYIPGTTQAPQAAESPAAASPMARCLKTADPAACAGVQADPSVPVLENALPDIQVETLILDLNGGAPTVSKQAPAQAPSYDAPPPTKGKVSYPSVAITIEFDFNSDRIRGDQLGKIFNLINALQDPTLAGTAYAVIGHTDAKGRAAYNCELSQRRAGTVAQALRDAYVTVPLYPVGFGEHALKNTYDPHAAENRRVTFLRLPHPPNSILDAAYRTCGY
ncbi:MAG: OmpA family protein [Pelagimonas sp.]|jgi:outer membrane protein OmpA-like peptidoglycan-associated protein|nr:OmpA family protein [Pelagimonas sp.]